MNFELEIREGFTIELPISEKPWIEKHDWFYDDKLGQIYRVDGQGRKVPLWLDLLRNSEHEERDIRAMLVIEDSEIEHIFTTLHFDLWAELQVVWLAYSNECDELNLKPGEFYEFVALSFCSVLGSYYDWEKQGVHKSYTEDKTHLTPGWIYTDRVLVKYDTLGQWFNKEVWDWVKNENSPCGISPETQVASATSIILRALCDGIYIDNGNEVDDFEIESLIHKYLEVPIEYVVAAMCAILYYYPIPTYV